jgi:O-antigen ligase
MLIITILDILFICVVAAGFALGMRLGVTAVILMRPLYDRLFEASRFDDSLHQISWGALINIVIICAVLFNINRIWRRVPLKLLATWLPFLLIAFAAVLYSPEQVQVDGFRKFLTYVTFSGMFVLAFALARSEHDVIFYLKVVLLSSVIPVLYGLFQAASRIDLYQCKAVECTVGTEDFRVQSTFSHPNIFAFYVLAIIGVVLFMLSSGRISIGGRFRLVLNGYLIPLLVALIMTKTRSAWMGCLILFLVYGLVYDKRVLILVLVAPIFALFVPAISDRVLDLLSRGYYNGGNAGANVNSLAWRMLLWRGAIGYVWQQPMFGFGLDSFHFYSPQFFPLELKGTFAHNVFIQFLFEMGLIGLLSFLWIFWRCYVWVIRYWQTDRRGLTMVAGILGTFLVTAASDNLFEYLSFEWCFWFSIGVIFSQQVPYRLPARNLGGRRYIFGAKLVRGKPKVFQARSRI